MPIIETIMSGQTEQAGTVKGIDGAVSHCPNCGVEFLEKLRSAEKIKCENCNISFSVRIFE